MSEKSYKRSENVDRHKDYPENRPGSYRYHKDNGHNYDDDKRNDSRRSSSYKDSLYSDIDTHNRYFAPSHNIHSYDRKRDTDSRFYNDKKDLYQDSKVQKSSRKRSRSPIDYDGKNYSSRYSDRKSHSPRESLNKQQKSIYNEEKPTIQEFNAEPQISTKLDLIGNEEEEMRRLMGFSGFSSTKVNFKLWIILGTTCNWI